MQIGLLLSLIECARYSQSEFFWAYFISAWWPIFWARAIFFGLNIFSDPAQKIIECPTSTKQQGNQQLQTLLDFYVIPWIILFTYNIFAFYQGHIWPRSYIVYRLVIRRRGEVLKSAPRYRVNVFAWFRVKIYFWVHLAKFYGSKVAREETFLAH